MKPLQITALAFLCALEAGFASVNEPSLQTAIDYRCASPKQPGLTVRYRTSSGGAFRQPEAEMFEATVRATDDSAIRLVRGDSSLLLQIETAAQVVPPNHDYAFSTRINLNDSGNVAIAVTDVAGGRIGGLFCQRKRVLALDGKNKWTFSGIEVATDKWITLTMRFTVSTGKYQIVWRADGGQERVGRTLKTLSTQPPHAINYLPQAPPRSSILIDYVRLQYAAQSAVENRVDALEGAIISGRDHRGVKRYFQLNDGNIRDTAVVATMPLIVEMDLAAPTRIGTFRMYDGDPRINRQPSGPSRATVYRLEGLNRAGQWLKLAERTAAEGNPDAGDFESSYHQDDFDPIDILQLKLFINDSNDTKRRLNNRTVGDKVVILRELGLLGGKLADGAAGNFTKNIFGEFRLPVYRDQREAALHLHNARPDRKNHKVKINFRGRASGKPAGETREAELAPGENIFRIKLDEFADGEYIATITDAQSQLGRAAAFRRLLRLQRSQEPPKRPAPVNLTGKKMFFPDAYYLDSYTNIKFAPTQAEALQIVRPASVETGNVRHGYQVYVDGQNRLHIPFYTVDKHWTRESRKTFIASQTAPGSDQWTFAQTAKVEVPGKVPQPSPIDSEPPPAGKPDWAPKPKDGEISFRFYAPDKDGPVDLRQVKFEYTRRYSAASVLGETGKIDWGVITPPVNSTFPIWYRSPGEAIILSKTPLLRDHISAGEFEKITDSNDNTVGQWISDDGRTLSYARGRLLRRYPPFAALYDNLAPASRILSIVSTTDGLSWNYSYMIPPDENLPAIAQQYGAKVSRVPDGNGLMQAFVYRYLAREQTISIGLAYSWDGANWRNFTAEKIFVENGPPGTWNAGSMSITHSAVVIGMDVYQLLSWVHQKFHFYGEIDKRADFAQLDGAALKKYFAGRELEKWPYFEAMGGYDGIAADARNAGFSVGLAKYRLGGLFSLGPEPGATGEFTTGLILASSAMTANVDIAKGGFLEIELLDKNDKNIPAFSQKLTAADGIELALFPKLPPQPFKVRARMKKATLYSIRF
ncbi:MAG: hypothetical protein ACI9OD_000864 [Limisphaerales bacterium]|jgi:hypothetical protein